MNKSRLSQPRLPPAERGQSLRHRTGQLTASLVAGALFGLGTGCSLFHSVEAPPPPQVAPVVDHEEDEDRAHVDEVLARVSSLEADSEFLEALGLLAQLLADHPDLVEGEAEHRERLRSALRLAAVEAHRSAGRTPAGAQEFDKVAAVSPQVDEEHETSAPSRDEVLEPLLNEAKTARENQDDKKLLEIYEKIREVRPLDSEEWLYSGEAHENLGDASAARQSYESILREASEYVEARTRLARMARSEGDLARAKAELERARSVAPDNLEVATRYAEVCTLLDDPDAAIAAWKDVRRLRPQNPEPSEAIGAIEERRRQWEKAGDAYLECQEKTTEPRLDLLLKMAEAYGRVGREDKILEAYLNVLEGLEMESAPPDGESLKRELTDKLHELGFVLQRGTWVHQAEGFAEKGWVLSGQQWIRPEEARLRNLAERIEEHPAKELRTLEEKDYKIAAGEKRLLKGMDRREIVEAWGFFDDQNEFRVPESDVVYEQLLYTNGREIYLRNGLVCDWSN